MNLAGASNVRFPPITDIRADLTTGCFLLTATWQFNSWDGWTHWLFSAVIQGGGDRHRVRIQFGPQFVDEFATPFQSLEVGNQL